MFAAWALSMQVLLCIWLREWCIFISNMCWPLNYIRSYFTFSSRLDTTLIYLKLSWDGCVDMYCYKSGGRDVFADSGSFTMSIPYFHWPWHAIYYFMSQKLVNDGKRCHTVFVYTWTSMNTDARTCEWIAHQTIACDGFYVVERW
jgi:hypothetical protein